MRTKEFEEAIETNIAKFFKTFYENPAFFFRETDAVCYLYSLLINDPFFKKMHPRFRNKKLKRKSTTLLVHTEISREIRGKDKICDLMIWEPTKTVGLEERGKRKEKIGIELKFNRRDPARESEKSGILGDVKKARANRKGYVLWMNWEKPLSDKNLEKTEKLVKRYENVKLYYLDVFQTLSRQT